MGTEFRRGLRKAVLLAALIVPSSIMALEEDSDASTVVGQTLRWEGNEDALRYEVVVTDGAGKEVFHQSVETPSADLRLKPGTYRYHVLVYNALNQLDSDSSWQNLVVLKAEIPGPQKVIPDTLYLESPVFQFKVEGSLLVDGAKYRIYRQDNPQINATAEVAAHPNDQEVELKFPNFEFTYGDYNLTIENPGGLKHTLKNALRVRYEKPIDVQFSVGWAPMVVLYDAWYRSTWSQGFYPEGADSRLAVMFLKKSEYQLGAELEAHAWLQTGGISTALIHSEYLSGGANLVYTTLFTKQFRLSVRAGGGVLEGAHAFDYQGTSGLKWNTMDPYASTAVSVYYAITPYWYIETGVGLLNGFGNGYQMGFLQPTAATGLSF
jgi:hypothetical protein